MGEKWNGNDKPIPPWFLILLIIAAIVLLMIGLSGGE